MYLPAFALELICPGWMGMPLLQIPMALTTLFIASFWLLVLSKNRKNDTVINYIKMNRVKIEFKYFYIFSLVWKIFWRWYLIRLLMGRILFLLTDASNWKIFIVDDALSLLSLFIATLWYVRGEKILTNPAQKVA